MSIEAVASAGNMIPYELLTGLGQRYSRVYIDE
jgi:alanine racemase